MRDHNAAAQQQAITLAGCLAHARREFYEARETAPRRCGWVLRQIANLYQIEAHLRERKASPKLRKLTRQLQSQPILQRLHAALNKLRPKHLPQSALGKAITYTLNQWPQLCAFVQDGRVEIDNNLVENAIRPTAIGKKNWMFIGAADAGQRGAILYTIVESCRRRGIDPLAYLRDVLTRLPSMKASEIKDNTPAAWAKAQRTQRVMKQAA